MIELNRRINDNAASGRPLKKIKSGDQRVSIMSFDLKIVGNHVVTKSLNVVLPLIGIGLMLVYEYCDTSCSYLKGSFLGIDLKWVGIIYMVILFLGAFGSQDSPSSLIGQLRTTLISAAVGAEFFLIGFQIVNDTYCNFCLAFSACIFILFGINLNSMNKWVMVASVLGGLLGFTVFFEGHLTPRFDL
jgi:hypothetical protein